VTLHVEAKWRSRTSRDPKNRERLVARINTHIWVNEVACRLAGTNEVIVYTGRSESAFKRTAWRVRVQDRRISIPSDSPLGRCGF
jgi:biotin synthase-related radical SAM superfamily protein